MRKSVVQEKYDMWNKITGSNIKYHPIDQAEKQRQYDREMRKLHPTNITIGELVGEEPKKKDELPEENSLSFPSTMTGEAHLCKKCGSVLNVVQSKKPERHGQWYRICPKYSSDDKGHTFEWVE